MKKKKYNMKIFKILVLVFISHIISINDISPDQTTDGGTSDGRFIAPTGAEVVELGPVNDSIHKIDERVKIEELTQLSKVYKNILKSLLT